MSWHAHKTTSKRKLITLREWAYLFYVKPSSIFYRLEQYQKQDGNYNPYDIYSVLAFYRYLLKIHEKKSRYRD